MPNKRKRPRGFTEPQEEKTCITCKVYDKCGVIVEANKLSKRFEDEPLDDNWYCASWEHEDVTVQHNNNNDRR